jgi:curved DNA-binding protein
MPAYKDYYKILEVPRTASEAEIKKAYRRLARKHHPDVSKAAGAEGRFKEITEANEVLGDPEKRRRYDELGANWQAGQDFRPPPGWQNAQYEFRGAPRGAGFDPRGSGDFSDFFESIFGGQFGGAGRSAGGGFWEDQGGGRGRGEDHEAPITISLEEAYHGVKKSISLQLASPDERGRVQRQTRTYQVRIPPGTTDGARIRLAGQGGSGQGGGAAGDLFLLVRVAPHPLYKVDGRDIETEVPVTPWEAALGARITIPTPDGQAAIQIPAGTESGHRLRLRGKGMPGPTAGDLMAVIRLVVPKHLSPREKELLEEWARVSAFRPRE